MSKIVEHAILGLGGLSLFAVCFLGFTIMADVPLEDVPVVGTLFEREEVAEVETGGTIIEAIGAEAPTEHKSDDDVLASTRSILGSFSFESPYAPDELRNLADELKLKRMQLVQRLEDVAEREGEVDERMQIVAERLAALEELQKSLETFEAQLDLREKELRRGEAAASERMDAKWADLGKLFAAQDDAEQASKRLEQFSPEDAARILRSLDPETAATLLNGISQERFKDYAEAYRDLRPAGVDGSSE